MKRTALLPLATREQVFGGLEMQTAHVVDDSNCLLHTLSFLLNDAYRIAKPKEQHMIALHYRQLLSPKTDSDIQIYRSATHLPLNDARSVVNVRERFESEEEYLNDNDARYIAYRNKINLVIVHMDLEEVFCGRSAEESHRDHQTRFECNQNLFSPEWQFVLIANLANVHFEPIFLGPTQVSGNSSFTFGLDHEVVRAVQTTIAQSCEKTFADGPAVRGFLLSVAQRLGFCFSADYQARIGRKPTHRIYGKICKCLNSLQKDRGYDGASKYLTDDAEVRQKYRSISGLLLGLLHPLMHVDAYTRSLDDTKTLKEIETATDNDDEQCDKETEEEAEEEAEEDDIGEGGVDADEELEESSAERDTCGQDGATCEMSEEEPVDEIEVKEENDNDEEDEHAVKSQAIKNNPSDDDDEDEDEDENENENDNDDEKDDGDEDSYDEEANDEDMD